MPRVKRITSIDDIGQRSALYQEISDKYQELKTLCETAGFTLSERITPVDEEETEQPVRKRRKKRAVKKTTRTARKTKAHRKGLSNGQKARQRRIRQIQRDNDCTYGEASKLYAKEIAA